MNLPTSSLTAPMPEPDLGYFLTPLPEGQAAEALASAQLHVTLLAEPTEDHFDPTSIRLPVADSSEGVQLVTLELTPPTAEAQRAGMGRIVVEDRLHEQVYFFTFGGSLTITVSRQMESGTPNRTEYVLTSTAPILALTHDQRESANQLADDLDATLARIRAGWGTEAGFWRRLAQVDPILAYVGGVKEVYDHYAHVPALGQEFPRLAAFLGQARSRLVSAGLWTDETVTLSDLLAPARTD